MAARPYWLAAARSALDSFARGEAVEVVEIEELLSDDYHALYEQERSHAYELYRKAANWTADHGSEQLAEYMRRVRSVLVNALYYCEQAPGRKSAKTRGGFITETWDLTEKYIRLSEQDKALVIPVLDSFMALNWPEERRQLIRGCAPMFSYRSKADEGMSYPEARLRLAAEYLRAELAGDPANETLAAKLRSRLEDEWPSADFWMAKPHGVDPDRARETRSDKWN